MQPDRLDHGATPSTSAMLVMLLPTALPSAIPPLPSSAAVADTSISGAEVPKPDDQHPDQQR